MNDIYFSLLPTWKTKACVCYKTREAWYLKHGIHSHRSLWSLRHVVDLVLFYFCLFSNGRIIKKQLNKYASQTVNNSLYMTSVRTIPSFLYTDISKQISYINKWRVFCHMKVQWLFFHAYLYIYIFIYSDVNLPQPVPIFSGGGSGLEPVTITLQVTRNEWVTDISSDTVTIEFLISMIKKIQNRDMLSRLRK